MSHDATQTEFAVRLSGAGCLVLLSLAACAEAPTRTDAGAPVTDVGAALDSGIEPSTDTGVAMDAGPVAPSDAGQPEPLPACQLAHQAGQRHNDLAYALDHPRQILDLIETTAPGPSPVIVWIHGGGWRGGSKSVISFGDFSRRGYVLVALEYRLSDEPWPATLVDVKAAIRWLRAHAQDYGIDPNRIAVAGSSAGGHLASFLGATVGVSAFDDASLGNAEVSSAVNLVVNYYGPSDLAQMDDDAQANNCPPNGLCHLCPDSPETGLTGCTVSDCPERWAQASPITHVDGNEPPFLSVHGSADCTVPTPQSQALHEALLAAGQDSELILAEGAGHNVRQCNRRGVQDQVTGYFERHLRGCELQGQQPPPSPPNDAELNACLHANCSELALRCEDTPECVLLEECFQSCFAETPERNCIRSCLDAMNCNAKAPPCINQANYNAVVQSLHRPLYDCGRAAGCYP